jgi:hypothetical protein
MGLILTVTSNHGKLEVLVLGTFHQHQPLHFLGPLPQSAEVVPP